MCMQYQLIKKYRGPHSEKERGKVGKCAGLEIRREGSNVVIIV